MKNIFKQAILTASCVATFSLLFSSCGEKSETDLDYLAVKMSKNEGWSIINRNGDVIVEDEYPSTSHISAVYDGVYWVQTGKTFQLFSVDDPKKPVIDEEFIRATEFHAGRSAVSAPNQPIRLINTSGETVVTLKQNIKRCYPFSEEGYAVFMNSDNKFGVIDKNGKLIIKPEYSTMWTRVRDGVVLASKKNDEKWIILDIKGNKLGTIDTEKYSVMSPYSEGKILVVSNESDDHRQTVLDKTGKKLFAIKKSSGYNYNARYIDGYVTFRNAEGQFGVADDEGNEVIRAKYNSIINLGKGEFAVSKDGSKWGVVNIKDEEVLDFDYSDAFNAKLGGHFWMKDGSEHLIVKKGDKNEVVVSFYDISMYASEYADYIGIESIVNEIMKVIEEYEQPRTASQLADKYSLSAYSYQWDDYFDRDIKIDDGLSLDIKVFFSQMTRQKTHTERVHLYGFYYYNRTVSDGWYWTNELPYKIECTLSKNDGIDANTVCSMLKSRLAQGRKKVSPNNDHTYYKSVKYNGSETNVYTYVSKGNNVASFAMNYGEYNSWLENAHGDSIGWDVTTDTIVCDTVVDW